MCDTKYKMETNTDRLECHDLIKNITERGNSVEALQMK